MLVQALVIFVSVCVRPSLCTAMLGSCMSVSARDSVLSPVYSNAGGLGSMTSNFQTLPLCLSTLQLLKQKENIKDLVRLIPAHSATKQTKL